MQFSKKNILALAVMSTFAGIASAQSTVSIYGVVDTGLVYANGGPNGSVTKLESGVSSSSRLGFRGTEDLGGGLSANFVLEAGMLLDTGELDNKDSRLFNRQSFVGLKGGFGAVNMGRQYTPIYSTLLIADPLGNNYGGASTRLMSGGAGGVRMNNAVIYSSPVVGGFSGQLAYGFGEVPGDTAKGRQIGAAAGYANGPLTVRLGYNQTENAAATDDTKNTLLVAKYDFGVAAASFGYGVNKAAGSAGAKDFDSRDMLLGVTVPFGRHSVMASYIRKDDRAETATTDFDANQYAIAYNYSLSKRTTFYTALSKLSNTRFNTTKFGPGDKEFDIGIRHTF